MLGEIPEGLNREPFKINLDLSFGINFTSEFWPTIKNQALEFDHEPFSSFQYFDKKTEKDWYFDFQLFKGIENLRH